MKIKTILLELLIAALILLFVYSPASKLLKFEDYQLAMDAQPLIPWFRSLLVYALPISELLVVVMMAMPKLRKIGLLSSLALLVTFTIYIILIKVNYYGRIPCSCGGVIKDLSWTEHLYFNISFIIINIAALWLFYKVSKSEDQQQNMNYSTGY